MAASLRCGMAIPRPALFAGFGPRALDFLRALAFHQEKAWFEANRALYEQDVRAPLEALIVTLSEGFTQAGLPLRGDARSIFRLHRDVRFGKDKRPYKTNAGAVLTRTGTKASPGLFYIHIDPEGCFAAAGFYRPEPPELAALRTAIRDRPEDFRGVLAELAAAGLQLGDGDPLTRLPKGFEGVSDSELGAAIRSRSLVVRRTIAAGALGTPELVSALLAFGREAEPLLRFGWKALEGGSSG